MSIQMQGSWTVYVNRSVRKTDGYSVPGPYWAPFPIVVGIKRP